MIPLAKKKQKMLCHKIYLLRWKILNSLLSIVLIVEIIITVKSIVKPTKGKEELKVMNYMNENITTINKTNIINFTANSGNNTGGMNSTLNNSITINNKLEEKKNKNYIYKYSKEELKYDSLFVAAERAKDFVNKSIEGILFNQTILKHEKPKISVVIPVYNCGTTIKRAIRSIQNQNYTKFEIILVNDFYTDNSSIVINQLQKEDPRIKIINNEKNMGTLYSRCIGVLSAKGKYIFPLDNDDMFLDKDVFYKVKNTAEKDNFDIVEFRAIESKGINNFFKKRIAVAMFSHHTKGRVLYQPELSGFALKPNEKLNRYHLSEVYIWAKCIKTEVYQKAVTQYGKERYSNYVITYEDVIINFIIFQIAESFHYIPKYGILRIFSGSSAYLHTSVNALNKYEMRLLDVVLDFSRNTFEGKKIAVNVAVKFLNNYGLGNTIKKEKYKILLKSILERIDKCEYISEEHKKIIREKSSKFKLN
jgi:glycosyltransferase involved in cell wall biosynthesis